MKTTVMDLRPQRKTNNSFGRKTLSNVFYRVIVKEYVNYLSNSTEDAHKLSKTATDAFYSEVVELLKAEGWKLKEPYGNGYCPRMVKGSQSLYCHPQSISGNMNTEDIEALDKKIQAMQSCEWEGVDVYENVIVTSSVDDTMQLYHQTYDATIQDILCENFSTKRKNLFYSLESMIGRIAQHLHIKIADGENDTVWYSREEMPYGKLAGENVTAAYVREKVGEMIAQGHIKTTVIKGLPHARWMNKAEERELRRKIA